MSTKKSGTWWKDGMENPPVQQNKPIPPRKSEPAIDRFAKWWAGWMGLKYRRLCVQLMYLFVIIAPVTALFAWVLDRSPEQPWEKTDKERKKVEKQYEDARKLSHIEQARAFSELWLEEARDRGGKSLMNVKSWKRQWENWDQKAFKLRYLIDHSDSNGYPVTIEYLFVFERDGDKCNSKTPTILKAN